MTNHVDALFLTETWLSPDSDPIAIGELTPPGYEFINIPRGTDNHGGIGIVHHKSLKFQILPQQVSTISFEHAIIFDNVSKIHFVVVYRPPPSTENTFTIRQFLTEFDQFVLYINTLCGKVIYIGDFNVQPRS